MASPWQAHGKAPTASPWQAHGKPMANPAASGMSLSPITHQLVTDKNMSPVILPYRLCISVARSTVAATLRATAAVATLADVVEIRLDTLTDRTSIAATPKLLLRQAATPLLFANRPTWENGGAAELDPQRIIPLIIALNHGCDYVDIELRSQPEQLRQVIEAAHNNQPSSRVIVSWHDFVGTPDAVSLREILDQQQSSGADIGKIVTMANSTRDVLRVLALLEEAAQLDFPLIAFCMGEIGKISRVATGYLGGYMTYAAEADGQATAPGQLPAARLREIETMLSS